MSRSPRAAVAQTAAHPSPPSYAELEARIAALTAELREAREQQTATADVLQVINSSPGNLAPVFDAMLERAMRLCDAAFGVMQGYDGERFYPRALRGVPPAYAEFLMRVPLKFSPDTALGRIEAGEEFVHFADVAVDGPQGSSMTQTLQQLGGIRSVLFAALRKDGALLGAVVIYRQEARPFSGKQIALLQNFAAQAVIAMENARLLTETREALDQQTATAEVLQVINSSPGDLVPVFETMLEKAIRLCETAFGILWTYDGELFSPAAVHGPASFLEFYRDKQRLRPVSGSWLSRHVSGEDLGEIADMANDPYYREGGPRRRACVELGGARSAISIALRKDGTLLGAIQLYRQEVRPFSGKQIALLQNFAAQAVIAMENARLLTETREALEQQTATAEVLQVINSSPGNLAPVFDTMLEKAMRLCDAAFGMMVGYDGEQFPTIAIRDLAPWAADFLQKPLPASPGSSRSPGLCRFGGRPHRALGGTAQGRGTARRVHHLPPGGAAVFR